MDWLLKNYITGIWHIDKYKKKLKLKKKTLADTSNFSKRHKSIFTFVAILVGAVRTYWKLESVSSKGWMPTPPPPLLPPPITSSILEGPPYNPLARLWCNNSLERLSPRFFLKINIHLRQKLEFIFKESLNLLIADIYLELEVRKKTEGKRKEKLRN